MPNYQVPGVWIEESLQTTPRPFLTGVPVFMGLVRHAALVDLPRQARREKLVRRTLPGSHLQVLRRPITIAAANDTAPELFSSWTEFEENYGFLAPYGYLTAAVRGFFENNGAQCYSQIIYYDNTVSIREALAQGLATLQHFEAADLICAPDIMHTEARSGEPPALGDVSAMQKDILNHCNRMGDRFAVLDSMRNAEADGVLTQQRQLAGSANGALYFPWIITRDNSAIPPCGHVAGVYARSDSRIGVHKAPANETLEGVLDLAVDVDHAMQALLNPAGINCLRAFAGRGIRVWGARTVQQTGVWTYVNVRRLFITVIRWALRFMNPVVYEPHRPALWARITRELTAYLSELHRRGGFLGATPQEAFFVKCDAENNPREVRDAGLVIADIGLAVAAPAEFIVVRIAHGIEGADVTVTSPQPVPTATAAAQLQPRRPADVRIVHLEYNPAGPAVAGEYVLIHNSGRRSVDLTGWTLSDTAFHTFRLPPFILAPNAEVRVWTRAGLNTAGDLYWGRRAAVWNNAGDRAFLRDSRGLLVSEFPAAR